MVILVLANVPRVPRANAQVPAKGGGLEVGGDGTLLVTERCLIKSNRNLEMNKAKLKAQLKCAPRVGKVIWLKGVMAASMTDCILSACAGYTLRSYSGLIISSRLRNRGTICIALSTDLSVSIRRVPIR